MTSSKATREQLREHNRRLVLRILYQGEVNTRAGLANVTGLTKPTISNLIGELISEGLVTEEGLGRSSGSGGKRPTLLAFNPSARHLIGVAVGGSRVTAVLTDLAGASSAVHVRDLDPVGEEAVVRAVTDVVASLTPQLDAPLLAVGVAVPGHVKSATGVVRRSAVLELRDSPLGELLARACGVPVHVGNFAELCALGQFSFGFSEQAELGSLVTLTLDDDLEIGVVLYPSGAHFGSELSGPMIEELRLGWRHVRERVAALATGDEHPRGRLSYLDLRRSLTLGESAAATLLRELAAGLAVPVAWVVALLRPANVSLAGRITDLGGELLRLVAAEADQLLGAGAMSDVTLSMAYSSRLGAMGGVALASQAELELVA